MFEILHDFSIQGQCLASVKQGGDDNGAEHRKFCSEGESVFVEYAQSESSEGPMSRLYAVINFSFSCSRK